MRGTHPELSGHLEDVDSTIRLLVKQIGAVVLAQDVQAQALTEDLSKARADLDQAERKKAWEAEARSREAEERARAGIAEAQEERDRTMREAADARSIAEA